MATPLIYITTVANASDTGTPSLVAFDAVLSLTPTYTKRVTSYATSSNESISNNTTKSNPTFQMTAVVSTQPLQNYDNNLIGYDSLSDRPQKAYDQLLQWWKDDTDITLVFEQDIRSPLVITNLSPANTSGTDSLTFSISFEEVRRVTYSRVTLIQNTSSPLAESGKPNESGRDSTKDVSDKRQWKFLETLDEAGDALESLAGLNEETE